MEYKLSGGKGALAGAGGREIPTSWAHLNAWLGLCNQPLGEGWTLFHSVVGHSERHQAGVDLLITPWFSVSMLEFTLVNMRIASLQFRVR